MSYSVFLLWGGGDAFYDTQIGHIPYSSNVVWKAFMIHVQKHTNEFGWVRGTGESAFLIVCYALLLLLLSYEYVDGKYEVLMHFIEHRECIVLPRSSWVHSFLLKASCWMFFISWTRRILNWLLYFVRECPVLSLLHPLRKICGSAEKV